MTRVAVVVHDQEGDCCNAFFKELTPKEVSSLEKELVTGPVPMERFDSWEREGDSLTLFPKKWKAPERVLWGTFESELVIDDDSSGITEDEGDGEEDEDESEDEEEDLSEDLGEEDDEEEEDEEGDDDQEEDDEEEGNDDQEEGDEEEGDEEEDDEEEDEEDDEEEEEDE
jgi:hypothetical protein